MTEKKVVRMLESIPKFDSYSSHNRSFEKVFRGNSLHSLIKILKHQKDIVETSILDKLDGKDSMDQIDVYNQEEDFKNIHNEEKYDIFDEKYDEKHSKNKKEEKKQTYKTDFKKKKFNFVLNPFKYNPNYNSIYKNIPSVKIIDPRKNLSTNNSRFKSRNNFYNNENDNKTIITNTNLDKNSNILFKKIEHNKMPLITRETLNSLNISKDSNNLNNSNNSNKSNNSKSKDKDNKENIKLPKLTRLTKLKMDEPVSENENHALRFSRYIPRKYNIPKVNKNVSYINPFNYIKPKNKTKSIDFDKMLHRDEKDFVYVSCLKNPSFCMYNPKYTYIDKNEQVKLFNPEDKVKEKRRKFLMRKLWGSYKVGTEYQLINNDKFNSNK